MFYMTYYRVTWLDVVPSALNCALMFRLKKNQTLVLYFHTFWSQCSGWNHSVDGVESE